jgi:cytochrome b6-f complex iron-sulfur subunit
MAQASVADSGVSRRRLFRWALLGTMGAIVAQATLSFIYFFNPQKTGAFGGMVTAGNLSDFPPNTVTRNPKGKYYMVSSELGLLALFWRCRHLGCTVPWNPTEEATLGTGEKVTGVFHCPCHGSLYTRNGQIQAGPAPGPLDLMEMTIGADGTVVVNTGEIRRRPHAEPSHWLPAKPGTSGPTAPDLTPHDTSI